MEIPIVFSTDNNYVMPTGVAILSLLESAKPTTVYNIFVLINDDVTEESKSLLRKQVECFPNHSIDFINVGKVFENSFQIRNISVATYSRLLIPWLLPQFDKIIFSDVDVIFRIDLSEVYNIDLSDKFVAGVLGNGLRFNNKAVKYFNKIGLNAVDYANAGFLLINSKLQREHNLINSYLEHSKKNYIYQDMDIINIVCKGKIVYLSKTYIIAGLDFNNFISGKPDLLELYRNPYLSPIGKDLTKAVDDYKRRENCILHYPGPKPWNTFTHAWKEWWNTYQCSIFYDPDREIKISQSILRPIPTWRSIAGQIKRKLFS